MKQYTLPGRKRQRRSQCATISRKSELWPYPSHFSYHLCLYRILVRKALWLAVNQILFRIIGIVSFPLSIVCSRMYLTGLHRTIISLVCGEYLRAMLRGLPNCRDTCQFRASKMSFPFSWLCTRGMIRPWVRTLQHRHHPYRLWNILLNTLHCLHFGFHRL